MLTIKAELNGVPIAMARVRNVSDLADVSDYSVEVAEKGCDELGIPDMHHKFEVKGHDRRRSVWDLIWKVGLTAVQRDIPKPQGERHED